MAPTRAGLFPAKQAKQASLSPAQPYSSLSLYSPSSPSTASYSPSSPRSPAYSTILTYHNSLSKTGCTLRQHRSMKRNRGALSSPASPPESREVLGPSTSSYCASPDLRSVNRGMYDRSAALRPRSHRDHCGKSTLRAYSGHVKTSCFPDAAKSSVYSACKYVDCEGRADSAACSDLRETCGNRRSEKKLQVLQNQYFLEEVRCRDAVFDVCFHTTRAGLLAAGLVNGGVELHQLPTAEEISTYLEGCYAHRCDERMAARRARRLKRRMQHRTSTVSMTGNQQEGSRATIDTPLLEVPRCNGDDVRTSDERHKNMSMKKSNPSGISNGTREREKRRSPERRRPRRQCAASTDVGDSAATTADDRREGTSYAGTRSPSRDTAGCAEDDSAQADAETKSRRKRAASCEQLDVNEVSSSDDSSCTSESSSSDEDEVFDETACRKELLDFETRVATMHHHKRGCRAVRFSQDGQQLISSSSDRRLVVSNFEAQDASPSWRSPRQSEAINALCVLTDDVIAAGDDGGCITLWDTRQAPTAEPIVRLQDHEDFISDLAAATINGDEQRQQTSSPFNSFTSAPSKETHGLPTHLVATGGDMLGVFDLRRKALLARSDAMGEDLHCVQIVKNGSKVVCGCQDGSLSIFSWGDFGDINDRLTGHKQSVDAMAKLEEDILITGSSDGLIRIVQLLPNAILGILGQHKDGLATVEKLALSPDKSLLASCSYDETISISQVAAAQHLIDGRRKRGKLPKKAGRQHVADLRRDKDFFDDL